MGPEAFSAFGMVSLLADLRTELPRGAHLRLRRSEKEVL